MPFFSIIIPTFNAERVLSRCLDSLTKQTFKDFEVLIMDGNSTDKTLDIVNRYYKELDIRWLSEPDQGLYDAINKGLKVAQGTYINILGSDDELMPKALQHISLAAQNHEDMCYAGKALQIHRDRDIELGIAVCDKSVLIGGIPFCHNSMFAHREAYSQVGNYNLTYKIVADAHWVHRAIKIGIQITPLQMVITRFHAGGISDNADILLAESYRLIQENFPELTRDDAEYVFFMSKGWNDGGNLELLLNRYSQNMELAEICQKALLYAPECPQRLVDKMMNKRISLLKRLLHQTGKLFR